MWFLTASCLHSVKPSRWRSCTRTRKRRLLPRTLKNLMHVFGCVSVSLLYCWPSVLCSSINSREHHYLLGLGMTRIQLFFLQSKCFKKCSVFVVYRGMSLHLWCMHLSFFFFCGCTHLPLCVVLWLHWDSLALSQLTLSIARKAGSNGLISPFGTGQGWIKTRERGGMSGDAAGMITARDRVRQDRRFACAAVTRTQTSSSPQRL